MKIPRLINYTFFFFIYTISLGQSTKKTFKYGVCGHPLTQEAYSKNIDLQIKLIKDINSRFYRFDIPIDSTGNPVSISQLNQLIQKLQSNKIKMLPILVFTSGVYKLKSSEEAYRKGSNYGKNFARLFKKHFDYYEVGNEEDNNIIIPQRAGNTITDFDTTKAKLMIPYFKGVCEAIKKEDPSAKLVINHGWVHWGFIELLAKYGVKYDILGVHWYSDMGDIYKSSAFGNVINELHKRFNKPIWLTEFNIKDGSSLILKKPDDDWFQRNLSYVRRTKYVDAVFIYELLDEPAFLNKQSLYHNQLEASFGLFGWEGKYTQVKKKPLFSRYQSFIRRNP